MFQTVTRIIKWASIPILLIASLFSCCAAGYEPLLDLAICTGAIIFAQRAVWLREYLWATAFLSIGVAFSPLSLMSKIFLLMGFACVAAFVTLVAAFRTQPRLTRVRALPMIAVLVAMPLAGFAQTSEPLDWQGKLKFHAESTYGPWAIVGFAAYAGCLQEINSPEEWGQGGAAYGKRLASTAGWSAIHGTLAFGLDSTLHQDPRYYRSLSTGFWRRSLHALRGTILTRTDTGGETLSTWRIGSAYGAAFLSNTWYPDRLNTARQGFVDGSLSLGFSLAANLGAEFWPDVKRKVLRRR